MLPEPDFESGASAISPLRQGAFSLVHADFSPRELMNNDRHRPLKARSRRSRSPRSLLLTAHHSGERWHGQSAGNASCIGVRNDPSVEAAEYLAGWEDLQAGRPARWLSSGSRATTAGTVNLSRDRCRQRIESGSRVGITFLADPAMLLRIATLPQSRFIHGQGMPLRHATSQPVSDNFLKTASTCGGTPPGFEEPGSINRPFKRT